MNQAPSPAADDGAAPVVTREIAAEAAIWIARLHGPSRSAQMERECREWQGRSAAHRLAFERSTDVWQDVPRVTLGQAYATAGVQRSEVQAGRTAAIRQRRWAMPVALALGVFACAVGIHLWRNQGVYSTDLGEQRVVTLDDGSRMSLNTRSRVRVDMGARQRTVDVESGEALFEVAKDAKRSFVVQAAGSEVVAHGTVFAVRLIADRADAGSTLDVTLLEGQVTVQAEPGSGGERLAPDAPVAMQPGQRIRLARPPGRDARVTQQVDRPRIEGVAAWRRNEAVFDDVALIDAVAEMNRYDRTPVVLVGAPSPAGVRVSGSFRTGDSASFARAVATLHGLVVTEREGRLELSTPP